MPSALHDELARLGAKWLKRQGFSVIATDLTALGVAEQADVIGFRSSCSAVIEAQASRSDFLADKVKPHRVSGGLGVYRFYLCPQGVIEVEDLPAGWGLLHAVGRKVIEVLKPSGNLWPSLGSSNLRDWEKFQHQADGLSERDVLYSIARRRSLSRSEERYEAAIEEANAKIRHLARTNGILRAEIQELRLQPVVGNLTSTVLCKRFRAVWPDDLNEEKEANMGQAKQRGTQADRIARTKAKIEALKPEYIVCNNCQAHINDIHAMDTRGMDGIDVAFAGICPFCGQSTCAVKGTSEAMTDFAIAMDDAMGVEAKVGAQLISPKLNGQPRKGMATTSIKFFRFEEAVKAAKNQPGAEFIGLRYVEPFTRLDIYAIKTDPEEPGEVNVMYEGGELFDLGSEEDFYSLDEIPDEAKTLFYARSCDLAGGNAQILDGSGTSFAASSAWAECRRQVQQSR